MAKYCSEVVVTIGSDSNLPESMAKWASGSIWELQQLRVQFNSLLINASQHNEQEGERVSLTPLIENPFLRKLVCSSSEIKQDSCCPSILPSIIPPSATSSLACTLSTPTTSPDGDYVHPPYNNHENSRNEGEKSPNSDVNERKGSDEVCIHIVN